MYGQANNASRIFELQQELAHSKQGSNQSFIEHVGNLKKKWYELRQYRSTTHTISDYVKHEEQDRIFQLLASVKHEYQYLEHQILMSPTLSLFTYVCSMIEREKPRHRVMNSESHLKIDVSKNLVYNVTTNNRQGDTSARYDKGKMLR